MRTILACQMVDLELRKMGIAASGPTTGGGKGREG
jgi:hypothetical protein